MFRPSILASAPIIAIVPPGPPARLHRWQTATGHVYRSDDGYLYLPVVNTQMEGGRGFLNIGGSSAWSVVALSAGETFELVGEFQVTDS